MRLKDIPSPGIYLYRMIFIVIGGLCYATSLNVFIIPNQFLSGGVSGIALILKYLFHINPSITIIALNIPIFALGFMNLDRHFVIASLIGMLSLSFFVTMTARFQNCLFIPDEILAAIFGGVLNGVGVGLLFKNRASFGGTDIISAIFKRKISVNLGTTIFFINLIIVGCASLIFEPYKGLYSLVAMFIGATIVDKVVGGFEKRFAVFIISKHWKEIVKSINHRLNRGATLLDGEGAYLKVKSKVIYTVIPSIRLAKLKDEIYAIDKDAFVSITPSSEIMGNWRSSFFSNDRTYKKDD